MLSAWVMILRDRWVSLSALDKGKGQTPGDGRDVQLRDASHYLSSQLQMIFVFS